MTAFQSWSPTVWVISAAPTCVDKAVKAPAIGIKYRNFILDFLVFVIFRTIRLETGARRALKGDRFWEQFAFYYKGRISAGKSDRLS